MGIQLRTAWRETSVSSNFGKSTTKTLFGKINFGEFVASVKNFNIPCEW